MGEIKSVKVDNWGVFFLQKLQNFFNKTDYCDLTLQFHDNSQLKVHRLVLNACTDYFNVLELTCEVIDDALIMPNELQADVVVPIVNFMYTGTLEFELKMYGKLLRTAKEMNMTVLLKLLEAHRRTMEGVNRAQRPPSPKGIRRRGPTSVAPANSTQQPLAANQRRVLTSSNAPQQRRIIQTKSNVANPVQQHVRQIGSTTLLKTTSSSQNTNILKQNASSPFEQLRKGYNNNKRPASSSFVSPPAKKPNIEDVKEFSEQQRMRKQIAAEYGDDAEYEGMLDDDVMNSDDDEDAVQGSNTSGSNQAATSRQNQSDGSTTITFKTDQSDRPPTIVVKDSTNSKVNHTKIITEVLRQYPHLVTSNKNIKLKIMPNVGGGQTQKIVVKRDSDIIITQQPIRKSEATSSQSVNKTTLSPVGNQKIDKSLSNSTTQSPGNNSTENMLGNVQKRRIDSKTMHNLIALGAENTTGPWLCLRCGINGRPISIPSYRGFRRHLINTHKETIEPALCEHCGWRSKNVRELHFHNQVEHNIKTTIYTFPSCLMCSELFIDSNVLQQHMIDSHPDENKQQCIYCNKIFIKEIQLYNHMKSYHKKQAQQDGIIDFSEDELGIEDEYLDESLVEKQSKVNILSDISLPSGNEVLKLEPSSEAAALSTVASGIATSIGVSNTEEYMHEDDDEDEEEDEAGEPKFVNADGNEVILTAEQRREILSQLSKSHDGGAGVVMVLNDSEYAGDASLNEATTEEGNEELKEAETETDEEGSAADEPDVDDGEAVTEEEYDDNQIFNEMGKMEENKKADNKLKRSKGSENPENIVWAENIISAQESANDTATSASAASCGTKDVPEEKCVKDEDIHKKLKELTGEWSEDEIDEDVDDESATVKEKSNKDEGQNIKSENDKLESDKDIKLSKNSEKVKNEKQDKKEDIEKSMLQKDLEEDVSAIDQMKDEAFAMEIEEFISIADEKNSETKPVEEKDGLDVDASIDDKMEVDGTDIKNEKEQKKEIVLEDEDTSDKNEETDKEDNFKTDLKEDDLKNLNEKFISNSAENLNKEDSISEEKTKESDNDISTEEKISDSMEEFLSDSTTEKKDATNNASQASLTKSSGNTVKNLISEWAEEDDEEHENIE